MPTQILMGDPYIVREREFYYYDEIIEEIIDESITSDREAVIVHIPPIEIVYEDYEPTLIDRLANAWDALMN